MHKKISTHMVSPESFAHAEVFVDLKEEYPYIKFFDAEGKFSSVKYMRDKTLDQAKTFAINWANDIRLGNEIREARALEKKNG